MARIQPGVDAQYRLMFDGASRGNPGPCACGYVIYRNNEIVAEGGEYLSDRNTNNFAEYMGLLYGLLRASELGATSLNVEGDSMLVINQVTGSYKVKSENLMTPYQSIQKLLSNFHEISFQHVKRKYNAVADRLANLALDAGPGESI